MLDTELLQSIATQLARGTEVVVAGKTLRAARTSTRLKSLRFEMNGRDYQAIEQNPRKPSRWGQLARDGHQVVQFRDVQSNKYVAVAVDGAVEEYGPMRHSTQDASQNQHRSE
ncbi:MAG TPA: hypothetical protein VJX16_27425 [Terriglobales bacterium]|nr:hypothetical protein [Terriglobales bacterium]